MHESKIVEILVPSNPIFYIGTIFIFIGIRILWNTVKADIFFYRWKNGYIPAGLENALKNAVEKSSVDCLKNPEAWKIYERFKKLDDETYTFFEKMGHCVEIWRRKRKRNVI